jgi:hypothetical protein
MLKKLMFLVVATMALHCAAYPELTVNSSFFNQKNAAPGDTYTGMISMRNNGNKPQPVRAYKTDYKFNSSGVSKFNAPGTDPRSNASWVSISPADLIIPPGGKAAMSYTVDVPRVSSLKGSYWSMIMIEPVDDITMKPFAENEKAQVQFKTQVRFGVQLATDIGENIPVEIKILNKKIVYGKGKKTLQLAIENTGIKWVRPEIWVELFNAKGIKMGKFNGSQSRIYPGCSVKSEIDLSNLPAGKYKTIAIIDCGGRNTFGGQYEMEIK